MVEPDAVERPGLLQSRVRTVMVVAGGVLGVVVVRSVFTAAQQVLGWALAASLLALFISPVVRWLDRALPRPLAVVASFLLLIGAIVGLSTLYSTGVRDEVGRLAAQGPVVAETIERRDDRIGRFATDIGLADQVTEVTTNMREGVGSSGDALRDAAASAPAYLVTLILTVFLLIFGGQLVSSGFDQLAPRHRDRLVPAVAEAARRAQVYVGASLVQAIVNGLAVFVVLVLLDAPAAGLLALVAAIASLVPYLGVGLGWIPVIVLGFGLASLSQILLIAALAIALQAFEGLVWRRFVDPRSLHLGPAIPVVVTMLGFGLYGIGGALCAGALVVVAVALVDQLWRHGPLPTPLDDAA